MIYTLSNEEIEVSFTTLGGTLCSIKDKAGTEYLWQGDKEYWSGQAPILFPICGSIRDDKAQIGNRKVTCMPRHGIVRKKEFQMEYIKKDKIAFSITSNEELKQAFPFDFKLIVQYELLKNGIKITYVVENTGKEEFPFFIGGHPGFNCPLDSTETYDDYQLIFEQEEDCDVPTPITETGLIDMEHRGSLFKKENILSLHHSLFEKDAIILDQIKSREVKMISKNSGKGISLSFQDFPYLILWSSANGGNFVALEPWVGLSTCSDEDNQFEHKRNVQFVAEDSKKNYSFEINLVKGESNGKI